MDFMRPKNEPVIEVNEDTPKVHLKMNKAKSVVQTTPFDTSHNISNCMTPIKIKDIKWE